MADLVPSMAWNVLWMRCSLAWTRTWMVTSLGMRFSLTSLRRKLNSVSDADGKPTSICLKPILTRRSKYSSFSSMLIGTGSDWLPSRRSTLAQMGGEEMT